MNKRKLFDFTLWLFLFIVVCDLSGCGEGREEPQADPSNALCKRIVEKEFSSDIFCWGAEE